MAGGRYLRAAFFHPLHLAVLLVLGVLAAISEYRWLLLPILAAIELAFLTLLAANRRFQIGVDSRRFRREAMPAGPDPERLVREMFQRLPAATIERFKKLRDACVEVRRLGVQLRPADSAASPAQLEELEWEGLDRLLWAYLRLLVAEQALGRFLEAADLAELARDVAQLEARRDALRADLSGGSASAQTIQAPAFGTPPSGSAVPESTRAMLQVVESNLKTSQERLENARQAARRRELIQLEIDRLEDRIRTMSEAAVNRPAASSLRDAIDRTVEALAAAETTVASLKSLTGIDRELDRPPQLITRERVQGRH